MNYGDQTLCKICWVIIPLYQLEEHKAGTRHKREKKKILNGTHMDGITRYCNICGWRSVKKQHEQDYQHHKTSKKHNRMVIWLKSQQ